MATETHDVVVVGGSTGHSRVAAATGGGPALRHEDGPVGMASVTTPTSTPTPGRFVAGTASARGTGRRTANHCPHRGSLEPTAHRTADVNLAETSSHD